MIRIAVPSQLPLFQRIASLHKIPKKWCLRSPGAWNSYTAKWLRSTPLAHDFGGTALLLESFPGHAFESEQLRILECYVPSIHNHRQSSCISETLNNGRSDNQSTIISESQLRTIANSSTLEVFMELAQPQSIPRSSYPLSLTITFRRSYPELSLFSAWKCSKLLPYPTGPSACESMRTTRWETSVWSKALASRIPKKKRQPALRVGPLSHEGGREGGSERERERSSSSSRRRSHLHVCDTWCISIRWTAMHAHFEHFAMNTLMCVCVHVCACMLPNGKVKPYATL